MNTMSGLTLGDDLLTTDDEDILLLADLNFDLDVQKFLKD
jgi:hypothetical protein